MIIYKKNIINLNNMVVYHFAIAAFKEILPG